MAMPTNIRRVETLSTTKLTCRYNAETAVLNVEVDRDMTSLLTMNLHFDATTDHQAEAAVHAINMFSYEQLEALAAVRKEVEESLTK